MKNITAFLRALLQLVLLAALVFGMVWLFRAASRGVPAAPAGKLSKTPPVLPTSTPEAYPPPMETSPTAEVTFPPSPEYIETTPGEFMLPSSTPWPTFTPYPTPTLRPGPTATSIPLVPPAEDAAGTISYITHYADGTYSLESIFVDAESVAKGSSVQLFNNINLPNNLMFTIFPAPDGSRLAITGEWGFGIIHDIGTSNMIPFSQLINFKLLFNWFPDNKQLLVRADDGSLWLADPISGENTRLFVPAFGGVDGAAASPDGRFIVYSYRNESSSPSGLWIVNSDGQGTRFLIDMPGYATNLSWSPDSKKIAFFGDGWMVIDIDSLKMQKLGVYGFAQCYFLPPLWSPDSRRLSIVVSSLDTSFCQGWREDDFNETNIILIDVESGESQPLLPDGSAGNIDPAWSPDGSQVAFVSDRSGTPELWAINIDGSNLRQLTQASRFIRFPDWRRP